MSKDQAPVTNVRAVHRLGHWSLVLGHFLLIAAPTFAVSAPVVVPVEDEPFAGQLLSIDPDGTLSFRVEYEVRRLPLAQLVRWSNLSPPKPQTIVLLDDGSRLVAAAEWAGGAAVKLDGDSLVVLSDVWDEIRLPKSEVRGFVFAQRSRRRHREQLERATRESRETSDQALLTNGDRLVGEVTKLDGGTLVLRTDAGDAELPLSRVEAVILGRPAAADSKERATRSDGVIVGLYDGSLLHAKSVAADEDGIAIELGEQIKLSGGGVADVVTLQAVDGPFQYLSDLKPVDERSVPYLDVEWPYAPDLNVLGEPLTVGGRTYIKGLGMHSAGRITYRLDGQPRRFDAEIGVDDAANGRGSVVFGVHALRGGKWEAAYTSGTLRGGNPPQRVSVDLRGAQGLALTVDYADRGDELDYADWLDARIVR